MAGLRGQAWRGGITLAVRQVLGMAVSFVGLVALARLIGPANYGIYISAFALHMGLVLLFQWGVDIYLIRKEDEPTDDEIHQAFTMALALGCAGAALAWPLGLAAEAWIGAEGVAMAVTVLFAGMPLHLAALVPSALLQRAMAYRKVAWAELSGQVTLYGGAVTAALAGLGIGAPLVGWWLQHIVMAGLFFALSGYRPRLVWNAATARDIARYGVGYAVSVWTWQLRNVVNPLVVARFLGPEAAAGVAIALRLVEALSFMKTVIWRISMPAMGRLQTDRVRLAGALAEGMRLQVLAVGPLLAAFAMLAPWVVPMAFGEEWRPAAEIFPFLALAWLVNAAFSLHSSALYVLGRNTDVTAFHLAHIAVLAAAAWVMVPRFGMLGYGLAEIAALVTYALLHFRTRAALGRLDLGLGLVWIAGFALPLFVDRLGPIVWAGPALVLILPATRRALAGWWSQIKELAHG